MINDKEKKLIQKYCILPKIGFISFVMSLVMGIVLICLVAISDLVFKSDKFGDIQIGIYTYLIIVAFYIVIFAYSYLSTHIGMRGKLWKNIANKVAVEQNSKEYSGEIVGSIGISAAGRIMKNSNNEAIKNAGKTAEIVGTIGTVAVTADIAVQMSKNAQKVAKACNVKIAKANRYILLLIVVPILILIATFIPGYIRANDELIYEKKVVSETVYKLQSVFEKECPSVMIDDPYERYQEYGYNVSAHLFDNARDKNYIYITVGNDGSISKVSYYAYIDFQKSKEVNIDNVEEVFSQLHKLLIGAEVSLSNDMTERYTLSDEFKEKFLNSAYDEKIVISESPTIRIYLYA